MRLLSTKFLGFASLAVLVIASVQSARAVTVEDFEDQTALDVDFTNEDIRGMISDVCQIDTSSISPTERDMVAALREEQPDLLREQVECMVCFNCLHASSLATLSCSHVMHEACFRKLGNDRAPCPKCRSETPHRQRQRGTVFKTALAAFERNGVLPEIADEERFNGMASGDAALAELDPTTAGLRNRNTVRFTLWISRFNDVMREYFRAAIERVRAKSGWSGFRQSLGIWTHPGLTLGTDYERTQILTQLRSAVLDVQDGAPDTPATVVPDIPRAQGHNALRKADVLDYLETVADVLHADVANKAVLTREEHDMSEPEMRGAWIDRFDSLQKLAAEIAHETVPSRKIQRLNALVRTYVASLKAMVASFVQSPSDTEHSITVTSAREADSEVVRVLRRVNRATTITDRERI